MNMKEYTQSSISSVLFFWSPSDQGIRGHSPLDLNLAVENKN